MSFASDIKDEVVRIRVRDGSVKLAELSGLTFFSELNNSLPKHRFSDFWAHSSGG